MDLREVGEVADCVPRRCPRERRGSKQYHVWSQVVEPVDAEHSEEDDGEDHEKASDDHLRAVQWSALGGCIDEGQKDHQRGTNAEHTEGADGDERILRRDDEPLVEGRKNHSGTGT